MALRTKLGPNFVRRVNGRIDFSSEPLLRSSQRFHHLLERCISDYEQVDVAGRAEIAADRRAEDQCHEHTLAEWRERLTEHVAKPRGLREQSLELGKDRRLPIGLEIHLSPLNGASYEPGGGQLLELSLHCAHRGTCVACDLAKIIGFVRVPQQPPEYAPAGTAEKDGRRIGQACKSRRGCSHNGYNRTQIGNTRSTVRRDELNRIAPARLRRCGMGIHTREHESLYGFRAYPFSVRNPWFAANSSIVSFEREEVFGTKLRALLQRRKNRDLFDINEGLTQLSLDPEKVVTCFDHYLAREGTQITRASAEERMLAKLTRSLTDDIAPLLSTDVIYGDTEAQKAFERVWFRLIARLSGAAWHRSEQVIEELRATSIPTLLRNSSA